MWCPSVSLVGVGQRLARRRRRARRRPGRVVTMGAKTFRDRLRFGRGRPHRPAVARSAPTPAPSRCCRRCAPRRARPPANPRSPSRCRCPATSADCPRAPSSSATPSTAGEAHHRRRRIGHGHAVGLVPDFDYDDDDRRPTTTPTTTPSRSRCPGRCTRCRRRRSASTSTSARPSTNCAPPCGRPPTRWRRCAPGRPAPTSPIRAGSSSRCSSPARLHRAPDHAPARALRVLENAAHVDAIITVSSGLMPIGLQIVVGDADRQRRAAPAGRRGAVGAAGRGQRDPAVGLASLEHCAAGRAQRPVDAGPVARAPAPVRRPWPVRGRRAASSIRSTASRAKRRLRVGRRGPGQARCPPRRACSRELVVEIPHHLDVVGDETDRADDRPPWCPPRPAP